ncbi:hypothetical protein HJFPF1_08008 [Paramyrothecium foliicola]|nr:hypothetical protein HJFPF1_08008 [Paramyrothecium foliicola]
MAAAAASSSSYSAVPSQDDEENRDGVASPAPTSTTSSPAATTTPFLSIGDLASTPPSTDDASSVADSDSLPTAAHKQPVDAASERRHSLTMTPADVAGAGAPLPLFAQSPTATVELNSTALQSAPQNKQQLRQETILNSDSDGDNAAHSALLQNSSEPHTSEDPATTGVQHEPPSDAHARHPIRDTADIVPTSPDQGAKLSLPPSQLLSPLHSGSVDHETRIAHPTPLIQTASDISRRNLKHPVPDLNTQSGSYMGNIAQLEATAERLSMTSSIDDAIRDLHSELKRSDSRRSSILAASARGWRTDEPSISPPSAVCQLTRHRSNSSSIVATNIAARHGGYSPAGYVMSPANSLTGRLRSGSKTSTGAPEIDVPPTLSRHGPGKASVRSIRSTKLSLAEISESEPISLTQTVLDAADAAPPIELTDDDMATQQQSAQSDLGFNPNFDTPRQEFSEPHLLDPKASEPNDQHEDARPSSARSNTTFQQAQDAFHDFDGVHCEPEDDLTPMPDDEPYQPQHYVPPPPMPRPQSYMDPETGMQMLYYPARVPAMLNLPPKLSSKPKAAQRDHRRSEILNAMMDQNNLRANGSNFNRHSALPALSGQSSVPSFNRHSALPVLDNQSMAPAFNRHSALPNLSSQPAAQHNTRDTWLPDPLAGHRDSFAALSSYDPIQGEHADAQPGQLDHPVMEAETNAEPASELRRPPRLSRMNPEASKSRVSRLDNLPPQLRASAYFELPSQSPQVEVKDGSAMATLDSILDASANAPVSAFTDHTYAGKLGSEIYGKEKKRKSLAPATALQTPSQEPKKRGSFMWLGKRSASHTSDEKKGLNDERNNSAMGMRHDNIHDSESQALASSIDGESVVHRLRDNDSASDRDERKPEDEDEDEDTEGEGYQGPPTTLLAELQLRKQQQKQRTQPLAKAYPNGMHATLLEMDAVAETQRKHRKNKRVNLAWEDPDAHYGEDESDDEDVPLAIIAAKSQGANNMADLERPIGLMEKREIEENEPLSHRRARLQGQDPSMLPKRPSMMNLPAPMMAGGPQSPGSRPGATPEPGEEEIEGETLGERKRRLAAKEEAEGRLPRARPVSSSFSAELLSQFGDLDEDKDKPSSRKENNTPKPDVEEETLGQRRRRLQAEREARQREMSYSNLTSEQAPKLAKRLSMSDVLSAHPKKDVDSADDGRLIEEHRLAREREAKMAAMRKQMPTSLRGPTIERSGGYQGGAFNDGNAGGQGLSAMRSQPNLIPHHTAAPSLQHRASAVFSTYGVPTHQPVYSAANGVGGMNGMMGYNTGNAYNPYSANPYGGAPMNMYAAGRMQPGMQMPMATNAGPVDRVEQWRQGVWQ